MKIQKFITGLFEKISNRGCKTSRLQIVGAFVAGMLITLALAQVFVNADLSSHHDIHNTIVPAPFDTPYFLEPDDRSDIRPVHPVERHTSELVYAGIRQEAIISV
jgi:hypothetical protein